MAEQKRNTAEIERQVQAAQRMLRLRECREDLIAFTRATMPDPEDPDDIDKSRYAVKDVHRYIADLLQRVDRGEILRLIINVQPRVGKSELVSTKFPAWFVGRDGYRHVAVGAYGDSLATDFGREARDVMRSPVYQQVFPGVQLKKGSQSVERLQTTQRGMLNFVGVGTGLTGKGADLLVVDDPIKDDEEARSKTYRDKVWNWFTRVAMTRLMGTGRVVICMTRWHEDDLIGRLTDPKNPHYDPEQAKHWTVVNIPAFAEDGDPLGRERGEILWPERTSREFLESMKRLDPDGFQAMFMGRPAPPEGAFFKAEHIKTYTLDQLPNNVRYYAASDHAVSLEQNRDPSCMGVVAVDTDDNIYVLPDLMWRQIDTETQVESMLSFMSTYSPLFWWAEKGHISQSIGPFLHKRMQEERTYCSIVEKTPVSDKQTRAQPIQARMAMGKVYLPREAPWFQDAKDELLSFPHGSHDDFVDFLAWVGRGLNEQTAAPTPNRSEPEPEPGSIQWIVRMSERIKNRKQAESSRRYIV